MYESDTFYEDEQEALQNLPKNESGLDRLLEHLYRTDSFFGYMFLFGNPQLNGTKDLLAMVRQIRAYALAFQAKH